jgi:hypothetical protein
VTVVESKRGTERKRRRGREEEREKDRGREREREHLRSTSSCSRNFLSHKDLRILSETRWWLLQNTGTYLLILKIIQFSQGGCKLLILQKQLNNFYLSYFSL